MKLPTVLTLLALALPVLAQEPPGAPDENPPLRPPGFEPGKPRLEKRDHMLENLDPEKRKRFQEARMKALQDPKIQELRKKAESSNREFFDAMKAKMKEIDPGLEGLLKDAIDKRKDGNKKGPGFTKKGDFQDRGLGSLSEGERQRLMAARENAKNDPAVLAAEQQRQQATTPEQRMEAGRQYMEAMKAAILKMEPSMAEILEKIHPPHRPQGPPPTANPGPEGMEGPEA